MRTEEQIISQEPIKSKLCGKEVSIPLLKIGKARLWKQDWWNALYGVSGWTEAVQKIEQLQKDNASDKELQDALGQGFRNILIDQPEKVIELVTSYVVASGAEITKEDIEENANEAEIAELWKQINDIAFPLVTSLADVMGKKK